MGKIQVKEVMTSHLVSVNIDSLVSEAVELFENHNIHHIPVLDEKEKLVGIISSADIDQLKTGATLFNNPKKEIYNETIFQIMWVREIMTQDVTVLSPDAPIDDAYQIFKENRFHALPIVDQEKLVGIVTPLDLLDYFFNNN